jgi:hypothetical protein
MSHTEFIDGHYWALTGRLRFVRRSESIPAPELGPNIGRTVIRNVLQQEWTNLNDNSSAWHDVPLNDEPDPA